jgi:hypothetical protein
VYESNHYCAWHIVDAQVLFLRKPKKPFWEAQWGEFHQIPDRGVYGIGKTKFKVEDGGDAWERAKASSLTNLCSGYGENPQNFRAGREKLYQYHGEVQGGQPLNRLPEAKEGPGWFTWPTQLQARWWLCPKFKQSCYLNMILKIIS